MSEQPPRRQAWRRGLLVLSAGLGLAALLATVRSWGLPWTGSDQERGGLPPPRMLAARGDASSRGNSSIGARRVARGDNPFCVHLKDTKGINSKTWGRAHLVPGVYWIGAPKTGTTSMVREFEKRFPKFMPFKEAPSWFKTKYSRKERNYFSPLRGVHPMAAPAFVKESPVCPLPNPSSALFSAYFTPSYLRFSEYTIPTMKDLYSNYLEPSVDTRLLKFIVSFRDPASRTESCFYQIHQKHNSKGLVFSDGKPADFKASYSEWVSRAIEDANTCLSGVDRGARALPKACVLNCLTQSLHVLHLRPWLDAFDPKQFFITDLETIIDKHNSERLYTELGTFLQTPVATPEKDKFSSANRGEYKKAGESIQSQVSDFLLPWESELRKDLCKWRSFGLHLVSTRVDCT